MPLTSNRNSGSTHCEIDVLKLSNDLPCCVGERRVGSCKIVCSKDVAVHSMRSVATDLPGDGLRFEFSARTLKA